MTLSRRIVAEVLGTAFLLVAVVGSGIMGEKLTGGNIAIALLANTLATGATLVTLIFTFGPVANVRAAVHHLRLRPSAIRSSYDSGRSLYHRRILVHGFHFLCQSGRNARASVHKHICRDSPS